MRTDALVAAVDRYMESALVYDIDADRYWLRHVVIATDGWATGRGRSAPAWVKTEPERQPTPVEVGRMDRGTLKEWAMSDRDRWHAVRLMAEFVERTHGPDAAVSAPSIPDSVVRAVVPGSWRRQLERMAWAALALNRAEAEHARDRLAEAFRQLDADLITDRWRIVYGLTIPPAMREWWWWR